MMGWTAPAWLAPLGSDWLQQFVAWPKGNTGTPTEEIQKPLPSGVPPADVVGFGPVPGWPSVWASPEEWTLPVAVTTH